MTYGANATDAVNWRECRACMVIYCRIDLFAVDDISAASGPQQAGVFWTVPQQKLGGSATVSLDSADGSPVSTAEINKTLYANIQQVTPSVDKTMVSYQWYKDGQPMFCTPSLIMWKPARIP